MKHYFVLTLLLLAPASHALNDYLKPEDQPFFRNDANGKNNLDRIDENVREINRLWGEVNNLKAEIKLLKEELTALSTIKTTPKVIKTPQ